MSSAKRSGESIVNGSIEIVSDDIVSESQYRTTGVVPAAVIMEDISPEREVNWDRCRSGGD